MIAKHAIKECNQLFKSKEIDIVKYNLYTAAWWRGRQAILLKNKCNISGEIIYKGMEVCILDKMQTFRFGKTLHVGMFWVKGINEVQILGVSYSDLILK